MLPSPSFTNVQSIAVNEFNRIRVHALECAWIAGIFHKTIYPKQIAARDMVNLRNKRFTGIHEIPIDKVIGTLDRQVDFDKNFRPLKKHLSSRWINALLQLKTDGWQPIVVHKVGEFYYVEEGHHRVSVAQAVGMIFIEAEVWDHGCCQMQEEPCPSTMRLTSAYPEVYCVNS